MSFVAPTKRIKIINSSNLERDVNKFLADLYRWQHPVIEINGDTAVITYLGYKSEHPGLN